VTPRAAGGTVESALPRSRRSEVLAPPRDWARRSIRSSVSGRTSTRAPSMNRSVAEDCAPVRTTSPAATVSPAARGCGVLAAPRVTVTWP
jgi:hypothetical protein